MSAAPGTKPTSASTHGAPPSRFARLKAATDRVPTKWFATIGTAVFLAVTAAFGGLNAVAVEEKTLATVSLGDRHESPQLDLTIQRVVLIDALRETMVSPEDDERLLVALVEVENSWTRPLYASSSGGFIQALSLGNAGVAETVVREDDQTLSPWLQPGVPALLAYTWAVPKDAYADGQEIEIVIRDAELQVGQLLYKGESWGNFSPAAVARVTLDDVGAGVAQ